MNKNTFRWQLSRVELILMFVAFLKKNREFASWKKAYLSHLYGPRRNIVRHLRYAMPELWIDAEMYDAPTSKKLKVNILHYKWNKLLKTENEYYFRRII